MIEPCLLLLLLLLPLASLGVFFVGVILWTCGLCFPPGD